MLTQQTISPEGLRRSIRPRELSKAASSHLNLFRSLAALAVVSDHTRFLFWVSYQKLTRHNPIVDLFYLCTGSGHQAVMVFFVLSGFFISATVFRPGPAKWSARPYAIDRFSRLYIVLAPALLLGLVCGWITEALPGGVVYFFAPIEHLGVAFIDNFTARAFAGNFFFLQESYVGTFGSNPPLWSLANEYWYYVAWALSYICAFGPTRRRRVIALSLLILCFLLISRGIWFLFPIWLMGAAIHVIRAFPLPEGKRGYITGSLFALFAGVLYLTKRGLLVPMASDYMLGALFTIALYFLIQQRGNAAALYERVTGFFADFSFSLYVVHFPVLILIRTLTWRYAPQQPSFSSLMVIFLVLLLVLTVSYAFSRCTERYTGSLRSKLRSKFLRER